MREISEYIVAVEILFALILPLGWVGLAGASEQGEISPISLRDALDDAEVHHPVMQVSAAQEAQARSAIDLSKSAYYPQIDFDLIESSGFSGSTSALGVTGLMGSPYRSGAAYGVVATQNLWDFGRTSNRVDESKSLARGEEEKTRVTRYELDGQVIQAYFDCALSRAQAETWGEISESAHLVTQEVSRFVRTGQRSIVDGYLSKTQEQQAIAARADFDKRSEISARRLGILIGVSGPSCPSISKLDSSFGFSPRSTSNPYVEYERRLTEAAQSRLGAARSDYLPKLVGIGSLGAVQDTHVVAKNDYSVGVGLIFPIFEGFSTRSEVDQDLALVHEHEFRALAASLGVDELNARLDEESLSAQARLKEIADEVNLARKAFETAKSRYSTLQGTLIDVRDALNDLSRVLTERNDVMEIYLAGLSRKQILNGLR